MPTQRDRCDERLEFGDRYYGQVTAFYCELPLGHDSPHQMGGTEYCGTDKRGRFVVQPWTVTWRNEPRD